MQKKKKRQKNMSGFVLRKGEIRNHQHHSFHGEGIRMAIKLAETLFSCLSAEDKCSKKCKIM